MTETLNPIPQHIIISRTDSIGDVVLTLPMAAVLKKYYPSITIAFMGKSYTRAVIEACKYVDAFMDVQDFLTTEVLINGSKPDAIIHVLPVPVIAKRARQLGIPLRIGTTNRLYHWYTCNKLVKLSRKNSGLHEAQLNIKLLQPFGITADFSLQEIGGLYGLEKIQPLPEAFAGLIDKQRFNLILHPKSQGNGREWPLDHFIRLVKLLDPNRYTIFVSGTEKERLALQPLFEQLGNLVVDITGKMNLAEFISFISRCNGLVASGTGPLHIAAAAGIHAFGLFPPIRPVHPGRWAPLGLHAHAFVLQKDCGSCKKKPQSCVCIAAILPTEIEQAIAKAAQQ